MIYENGKLIAEKGEKEGEFPVYSTEITIKSANGIWGELKEDIRLPYELLKEVYRECQREFYYKEDVKQRIDEMIQDGELPKEAYDNKEYIEELTNTYTFMRMENEGACSDFVRGWEVLLDDAFKEVDYKKYQKNKNVQR